MKLIGLAGTLALILAFASTGSSIPLAERGLGDILQGTCSNPIVRKEWRSLTNREKKKYIKAVQCLQNRPAITTLTVPGAVTRFDDFQGEHIARTDIIHYVGQFLPWHRYFVAVYENVLRTECGYTGGQPYWDWTLDYQNWVGSPIFDPTTGFGGNGPYVECDPTTRLCIPGGTGGGCVTDGPFKDYTIHLGPLNSTARNDHCLTRDFHPDFAATLFNPTAMNLTMSQLDFQSFRQEMEGLMNSLEHVGQHGGGHGGTGGLMVDLYASPGDPIFFLHHGNIDKLWWDWQNQDLSARLVDIAGPVRSMGPYANTSVTLDYFLDVGILAPDVKIRDVMNIRSGALCYIYQ